MDATQLKQHYDNLLKDEDFDKLELGLKNPNIFQILRITNNEIRHSNFLSWLLDPKESHKLGDIFLKRFLREVFSSDKFGDIDQVDVEGMDLSKVEIQREWKNIDILIILEGVVVCIENKVLSKEHSNQLKRYKEIIEKQFPDYQQTFVYLTPDGEDSEEETDTYEPISYEFIVDSLDRILSVYGESLNEQVKNYIKDYVTIIKRELMGTDKLTELSKKIYQNHKELFDFINEHKPDIMDEMGVILKNQLKSKGYIIGSSSKKRVRFTTQSILDLTYINKNVKWWKNGESFLFEFILYEEKNKLIFKVVISPSDKDYDVNRLKEMLLEIEDFAEPRGKKWLVTHRKNYAYDYSSISDKTPDEIKEEMDKVIEKVMPVLSKVEAKFMENKKELLELKNV
jgi:hypothetical protein